MSAATPSSFVLVWHHRVLGVFWALCGLGLVGVLIRYNHWNEIATWVAAFCGAICVPTGIGFISGRIWARRVMAGLMVVAALFLFYMMMMAGTNGSRQLFQQMLATLCIVGYTMLFLAISAACRSQGSV